MRPPQRLHSIASSCGLKSAVGPGAVSTTGFDSPLAYRSAIWARTSIERILSMEVRAQMAERYASGESKPVVETAPGPTALFNPHEDAIECNRCGGRMVRAGTCYTCRDCGTSTGCG